VKKSFAWLICLCALVACAAPTSQPTGTPIPTNTAVVETSTPAVPTQTPAPSPTQISNCTDPFQAPETIDPALLNYSAQQAQQFAQRVFKQMKSLCPDHEVRETYLRPNPNKPWIPLAPSVAREAGNFVLEFKITPKVNYDITSRFTVDWHGGNDKSPYLVLWPGRQFWNIDSNVKSNIGSGQTREILGDQPIKVLLVQAGEYASIYINNKPMGNFPIHGGEQYINFSAATDRQEVEFDINYIKLWRLAGRTQFLPPQKITLPEVSNHPDLSKVPPIPGSFGVLPDGWLEPGEMQLIRSAGFSRIRRGIQWEWIEVKKGTYNYASLDIEAEHILREGMSLHMLVGLYSDHWLPPEFPYQEHYKEWLPPLTAEAQAYYLPFLEDAVRHYQNKGVIWEIDGEPNRTYKSGKEYAELMKVLIPAIRRNDPSGLIVAPNIDRIDASFPLSFITALGDAGLLTELDAIGISHWKTDGLHPGDKPEDILDPILNIRKIVDSYSPDRQIPIVVNEEGVDLLSFGGYEKQAIYITRMELFHLAIDMPYTMWYLWRDWFVGGTQQSELWGLVDGELKPYPSFQALQTLAATLNGYEFVRRMPIATTSDYILFFRKENKAALAVWSDYSTRAINIPVACPNPKAVDMMGNDIKAEATDAQLTVTISDAPIYILCQDDAPAELIFWKPARTIQSISQAKPNVLVEISNSSGVAITGKFVLKSKLFADSEVQVSLAPGQSTTVEIPVPIKEWLARTQPVQLDFISEYGSVQSAMLWLSIIQGK